MSVRARWLLAALAVSGVGCPEPRSAAPPQAAASARRAASRGGIQVPLPDGWSAQVGPDDALQAGPAGRPILRIEPDVVAGEGLPAPEVLAQGFGRSLRDARFELSGQRREQDLSVVLYRLASPAGADAGSARQTFGMIGAKRLGRGLYWCSSIPGASEQETEQAGAACAGLSAPAR